MCQGDASSGTSGRIIALSCKTSFFLDGPNKYAARTCHRHVVHDAVIALRRRRYHRVGVRHREL